MRRIPGATATNVALRHALKLVDPVKCLGYSEETYVETIKITWVEGDFELGTETAWKAVPSIVSDTSTVSFDGKWKNCP